MGQRAVVDLFGRLTVDGTCGVMCQERLTDKTVEQELAQRLPRRPLPEMSGGPSEQRRWIVPNARQVSAVNVRKNDG